LILRRSLKFQPRITQCGFAATEEDPPNDAKKRERFRVRGQKPGISPFWRHLACLADHFFSPLGAPKWPREKIFASRDEFALSHCG
jgi:hypothetical protein